MAYENLKKKRGLDPSMDDGEFLRQLRDSDPRFQSMDPRAFARAVNKAEMSGAEAEVTPGLAPTPRPQTPPESLETATGTAAGSALAGLGLPGGPALGQAAGRFAANLGFEQAKDIAATAKTAALSGGPLGTGAVNVAAYTTPEEKRRTIATGVGTAAGFGAPALLGRSAYMAARPALTGALSGAGAGGLESAVRAEGDLPSTAGGAALGALTGGIAGKFVKPSVRPSVGQEVAESFPARVDLPEPEQTGILGMFGERGTKLRSRLETSAVTARLESLSPEGREMARLMNRVAPESEVMAGKAELPLKRAGFTSMKSPEGLEVYRASEGKIPVETMSPRARRVFEAWDVYRKGVVPRARAAGIEMGELEHYFPRDPVPLDKMRRGRTRQELIMGAVNDGRFSNEVSATAALDDYLRFVDSGGKKGGNVIGGALVREGQYPDLNDAKANLLRDAYVVKRQLRSSNIDYSRATDFPFYDRDPGRVIPRYIESTETRIKDAELLGPNLERLNELAGRVTDPEEKETLQRLFNVARRAGPVGEAGPLTKILDIGRRASTFALSPVSTLKNLQQGPLGSMIATDIPSTLRGMGALLTKRGREIPIESGAASETALRQVQHLIGGEEGMTGRFLKLIGFSGVERFWNRGIAANSGLIYAKKMAKELIEGRGPGNGQFAARELKKLLIDPDKVLARGTGILDDFDQLIAANAATARSQFRGSEMELPTFFTSSAVGRNVTQFKGFPFQQGRYILSKEVIDRLISNAPGDRARGLRNLAILGTVYPLTGEVIGDVISIITGRKRKTKGIMRYLENLTLNAPAGIAWDVIQSFQYDPLKFAVGPTLGRAAEFGGAAVGATKQLMKGEPIKAAQGRTMVRMIPGIGPLISNRLFPPREEGEGTSSRYQRRAPSR